MNKQSCTAADGKTVIYNILGYPLMVRAVDFNALFGSTHHAAPGAPQQEANEQLRHAGAMLSNCAFNLAQRKPGEPLTEADIRALDDCRRAWDAALSTHHAAPGAPQQPLSLDFIDEHIGTDEGDREAVIALVREVEAAHGITAQDNEDKTADFPTIRVRRASEEALMRQADDDGRFLNAQGHQQAIDAIDFCLAEFSRAAATAPAVSIPLPDLGDPRWVTAPAGGVTDAWIENYMRSMPEQGCMPKLTPGVASYWLTAEELRDMLAALTTAARAAEPINEVTEALKDAVAHLAGAASAYRTYAKRHASQGKALADPFFSTRIKDFDAAVDRGRAALTTVARAAEPAIHLGAEGQKVFAETLLNPPPPTAAFLKAEESYSNLVRPEATAPAGGVAALREALQFYANGDHFVKHDPDVWDTVSGEPANLWEDEANSATVEDGSIARAALTTAARAAEPNQGAESRQSRYRAALEKIAAMEYDRWSNGARAKEIAQRMLDAGVTPTAAEVVDYCARHGVSPAKAKEALTTAARAAEPEAYRVFKDGNQWCAVGPAFTNLQESPAGFADTPYLALERLTEAEAEERRKVWRAASPTPPTGTSKEGGEKP